MCRHQKRALLTSIHVAEEVCFPVPHRQVVFSIPKRLRMHPELDVERLHGLWREAVFALYLAGGRS